MHRRPLVLAVGALLAIGATACSDDDDGGSFGDFGRDEGAEVSTEVPGSDGGDGSFDFDEDIEVPGPSSDDGGGTPDDFGGLTEEDLEAPTGPAIEGGSPEETFLANCTTLFGMSQSGCGCAWDEISANVSESEYAEFEEEFLADSGTQFPSWLTEAVVHCS